MLLRVGGGGSIAAAGSMTPLRCSLQQSMANLSPTTCSFAAHALFGLPLPAPSLLLANWRKTCLRFAVAAAVLVIVIAVVVATVCSYFLSARTLSVSSALA